MKKWPISIALGGFLKASEIEAVLNRLCNIGYDCFDLNLCPDWNKSYLFFDSEEYIEYFERIRRIVDLNNTRINQTHAFFPLDSQDYEWLVKTIKRQIHATKLLGAKYIVIHPFLYKIEEEYKKEVREINVKFFNDIKEALIEHNIVACLENLWEYNKDGIIVKSNTSNADEINAILDELNDDEHFGICLDTGHMNLVHQNIPSQIRKMDKRLKALHINDNDGIKDDHLIPTQGNIDWISVKEALEEIQYEGSFNMELTVYNYIKDIDKNLVFSIGEFAYRIAEALMEVKA